MLPELGLIDQVTAVFKLPVTVAVNCCCCPLKSATLSGETDSDTPGDKLTIAVPNLVESAWLVAVTVTVC